MGMPASASRRKPMICSSVKRFFTSNLLVIEDWTPNRCATQSWGTSRELIAGRKIVVHCKGGLGRAGTVATMLLLDTGAALDGDEAIQMARQVRPGAIETSAQEDFIRRWIISKQCRRT
ncbi:protein-tyrosine phosphatase family protein [Stenotrophomonas sp.]|uniref:phosphatase domain-containing protein n=1 Tax=Stenotrophomonas sp. TaxID=69392 RepID=UPI0028AE1C84|nr:protein-tyrosine phosphatase family protein [Stenotrophomonas sp.]